jgi:hypothetical protein
MAKDLQIRAQLDTMRSLPLSLARLEKSLGTTQWPGQGMRLNFPSGMELTAQQRIEIEDRISALQNLTTGGHLAPEQCSKARLSLLTNLLLGYPAVGGSGDKAASARAGFYLDAVGDVAPWALDAAIKRWVRGDVENSNVDFAPSPGTLHRLCIAETRPFDEQVIQLRRLLSAVSLERAMDPAPIEPAPIQNANVNFAPQPRLRSIP